MKVLVSVFLGALLGLGSPACAQESSHDTSKARVERIVAKAIEDGSLEAVSVGITRSGKAITVHKGPLYRGEDAPANDETVFELRSITKTFAGTLAAQAILDGKLALNSDIRTYLDGDYPNLERDGKPILVRHLLTHTSGLPSNNPVAQAARSNEAGLDWRVFRDTELGMTKEKFFANLAEFELASVPGEAFNYSNLGTNLTALILERIYQASLDELVQTHILTPAGMKDTALTLTDPAMLERLATGYNDKGEEVASWPVWPMGGAEGAAKATVPDTIRYMQFHLDEANPAVKLSHVPLHELDWDYRIAAFWWVIDRPAGSQSLRHDGGYDNVRNVMILYPKDDLGVYLVTNRVTAQTNEVLTNLTIEIREALVEPSD